MNPTGLPEELHHLLDYYVWAVFAFDPQSHKKAPIFATDGRQQSATDATTLFTYTQAQEFIQTRGGVLAISLPLASEVFADRTFYVIDLDTWKDDFPQEILEQSLAQNTFIDVSPSGKGYHLWFSFNRKPKKAQNLVGVDHIVGFVTLSQNTYRAAPILHYNLPAIEMDNSHGQSLEIYINDGSKRLSPIRAFNEQCEYISMGPRYLLEKHGYITRNAGRKFLYPHSSTGAPGVAFYPAAKGNWEVLYSFHQDDPLTGMPRDPFDVFKILEHDGDMKAAIREAARICRPVDYETMKKLDDGNLNDFNDNIGADTSVKESLSTGSFELPEFPKDLFSGWPEPWPLLFQCFRQLSREPNDLYLTPTFISLHAFLLRGIATTGEGRRPQFISLTLAPSTEGKDVNSIDPLGRLRDLLVTRHPMLANSSLDKMSTKSGGPTADTSFLQELEANGGEFYWLHTEATRIYQQLSQGAKTNAAVAGLQDKLNDVYDGKAISGKRKVGEVLETIHDPNVQVNLMAQPDTVMAHISDEIIDGGLLGRNELFITIKKKRMRSSLQKGTREYSLPEEILDFYKYFIDSVGEFRAKNRDPAGHVQTFKFPLDELSYNELVRWEKDFVLDVSLNQSERVQKVWSRLMITAEKLYVVILFICRLWDSYKGQQPRDSLGSISFLFPYLIYQRDIRAWIIREHLSATLDPLVDALLSTLAKCIKNKSKKFQEKNMKFLEYNSISAGVLWNRLGSNSSLVKKLEANQDKKALHIRFNNTLRSLTDSGMIKSIKIGTTTCYGIPGIKSEVEVTLANERPIH